MTKTVILSAGGTGGHLFPAQALAEELKKRGWTIHLATDPRAEKFVDTFPADKVHIVKSATFAGKSPIVLAKAASRLALGYLKSRKLYGSVKPDVVVGFGGYPTVPPLLAAAHKRLPSVLHEQNAVMGRANKFLANKVTNIASGFDLTGAMPENAAPVTVTGNPLRQVAHDAAKFPYSPRKKSEKLNLLVFGGSQGAQYLAQVTPKALAEMDEKHRKKIRLTLQARSADLEPAREALNGLGVEAEVEEFFSDLPSRIAHSHLVMCRSGASSVSELALIGRPSILVPLPGALDDDQGANAAQLERAGGGVLARQNTLDAKTLGKMFADAIDAPEKLAKQAENAKKAGVPDAAQRLADLVEASL